MITMGLWDITINYYLLLMLHYHYCTLQHCSCSLTAQRIPISRSHPSKGPLAPASPIPAVDRCGGTRSRTRRSEGDVRCKTVLETPCFFFHGKNSTWNPTRDRNPQILDGQYMPWLMVWTYPSEKYEFVSWDDEIPIYEMENKQYLKPPTSFCWFIIPSHYRLL